MKIKIFKWLAIVTIGLPGCYDFNNFNNIVVDPFTTSYVVPVVNDSITFGEVLAKSDSISFVKENADHSYSILFRDTLDVGYATDQFSIPNQSFIKSVVVPFAPGIPIPANQTITSKDSLEQSITTTTEAGATVKLKRIDFSSGTLQVRITNNFHHSISGTITLVSLKNNQNVSFDTTFSLTTYGSVFNASLNIVKYYFDSYNSVTQVYNTFKFKVNFTITSSGAAINTGDNLAVKVDVVNPAFKKITGKINYSFSQTDQTFNTDFSQSISNVKQHFADPRLTLQFINSYGIPSSVNFTKFVFIDSSGVSVPLTTTGTNADDLKVGTPNNIPGITGAQQSVTTTLKLNKDNSNIATVFNSAPKSITLATKFDLGDNTTTDTYFIDQSSTVRLLTEVEIPIWGWVNIGLSDTTTTPDLPKSSDLGEVGNDTRITLKFRITNEIPFNISLQVLFLDANNLITAKLFDSVNEQLLIASSPVNAQGVSIGATPRTTEITLNKTKYDLISQSKKMIVKFHFITGGALNQDIKILSTNRIGIKASLQVSGTIKPNL